MVALDFGAVLAQWPALLRGAGFTLGLSTVAAAIGVAVGVACGWARALGPRPLQRAVGVYVELIRNTPFIVQLFFIYFGLPSLGLRLSPELASIIAMVVNLGAYAAEIARARRIVVALIAGVLAADTHAMTARSLRALSALFTAFAGSLLGAILETLLGCRMNPQHREVHVGPPDHCGHPFWNREIGNERRGIGFPCLCERLQECALGQR